MIDLSAVPLRVKLAAGSATRLILAIIAFGTIAYQATKQSVLDGAATRVRTAAFSLAQRSSTGQVELLRLVTEVARDSAIQSALRRGVATPAAVAALGRAGPDSGATVAVAIRKRDGTTLAVLDHQPPGRAADSVTPPDSARIGRLFMQGDLILYEFTVPVTDRGVPIGSVVLTRQVRVTRTAMQNVSELMGAGGNVLFGNIDGSLWTDLSRPVAGPPSVDVRQYRRDGRERLVSVRPIPRTPFAFAVEFPEDQILAPVRSLMWKFAGVGALIVGLGLVAGWQGNSRLIRPLTDLTSAAEAIAAGRAPEPRPPATRKDELGRLEQAFAIMASNVRDARENLEQQVADRTRALEAAQAALVRKERMAVLGQLAGNVGHELRNPLGVMSNAVFYLQSTLEGVQPKSRRYLGLLEQQIKLAEKIVSDILDFTRAKPPERALVDLAGFLGEQVRRIAPSAGVRLRLEVEPGLPRMYVDEHQIGQVVLNLLTNAMQAMEGREGTVTVHARAAGAGVRIEVADEGPGVPAEHAERIFEPLFTTKTRGFGLGLALSRSLAEANGGSLVLEQAGSAGATFVLELPAAASASAPADESVERAGAA